MLTRADYIISVSEKTKNDLISYYNIKSEKIVVIHHGYNFISQTKNIPTEKDNAKEYLLFVGDRQHYKNFSLLLKTFKEIVAKYPAICLYIIGGGEATKEEIRLINSYNLQNNVNFLGYIEERNMAQLYHDAIAFVFPSLMEGFGIPILESFANNCPCLLSDIEIFREIAGSSAEFFDPYSESSLLHSFEKIYNTNYREQLIINGQSKLMEYSWDIATKKTFQLYTSL